MADETQNVVLDFKMNGQVQFANTVKDINAVMNTAAKEYRAQISSMDENASSTQKLAAEQQKLQIQSEAAAKRTQILSEQLKTMQDRGETSGS
ncbi:phage tail tape measure protein, partial [Lacticaseibacillus paracasei]|nr:phage tail tape measure protein [Lacticaseibacillus paracasei]MCU9585536.1 phage tail tape measure protein [Lacticaseibacillus paracasei]